MDLNNIPNLKSIPESISNFTNMKLLEINRMPNLKSIPDSIGNLRNLEKLTITFNPKLTSLPDSICNLRKLTSLVLHGNSLTKIPNCIGNLNLIELNITANNITRLPSSMGKLYLLNVLLMEHNPIKGTLPMFIYNLPNLKILQTDLPLSDKQKKIEDDLRRRAKANERAQEEARQNRATQRQMGRMTIPSDFCKKYNCEPQQTLKKCYRANALKMHPDKNPNDRENAECKTKQLNGDYQSLQNAGYDILHSC